MFKNESLRDDNLFGGFAPNPPLRDFAPKNPILAGRQMGICTAFRYPLPDRIRRLPTVKNKPCGCASVSLSLYASRVLIKFFISSCIYKNQFRARQKNLVAFLTVLRLCFVVYLCSQVFRHSDFSQSDGRRVKKV